MLKQNVGGTKKGIMVNLKVAYFVGVCEKILKFSIFS